jgi:hypothetical protein
MSTTASAPWRDRTLAVPPSSRRGASGQRVLGALMAAHRWWVEVLVAVGFYLGYEATRGLAPGRASLAMSRGRALHHIEQLTHLAVEPLVAQALNGRHLLAVAAGYYYGTAHFAVTIAVLVWVYARRRDAYPRLRTTLLIISLAALVLFWAFPVAPPRLAVANTVDTLSSLDVMGASHPHSLFNLANPYAAMPSLHMAWAAWCALAVAAGTRRRWVRLLAWAYPFDHRSRRSRYRQPLPARRARRSAPRLRRPSGEPAPSAERAGCRGTWSSRSSLQPVGENRERLGASGYSPAREIGGRRR